ncbi:hypothetical protein E8L90_05390 [Brevibacillus antibioticus]|uniref:Uncharacterized protein n=1 Tax=Brevibacillus antibioticus TaxID=2570228 RepID=A0A4U2Y4G0_9BACL|nr:hypothetical protein [Brevibacillus antibioticus]TKI54925.1 hypothetical protein E8L90_05390 [Brevibacillus antibioticus]
MNKIVCQAYTLFVENVYDELTAEQQEYVDSIKEVIEKIKELQEMFDIEKVKAEILNKAEELCEGYLREKLAFLADLNVKGVPDVEISLSGTVIKFEMYIYIIFIDDDEGTAKDKYFALLAVQLEEDISHPTTPSPTVEPSYILERVSEEIRERVDEELRREKDAIIELLLKTFFSDYIGVFNKIKPYLDAL